MTDNENHIVVPVFRGNKRIGKLVKRDDDVEAHGRYGYIGEFASVFEGARAINYSRPLTDIEVATHESGHAVALVVNLHPFAFVKICKGRGVVWGVVDGVWALNPDHPNFKQNVEKDVIQYLAGSMAAEMLFPRPYNWREGCWSDFENAEKQFRKWVSDDPVAPDWLLDRAADLVLDHRHRIRRVAAELVRKRALSFDEVYALVVTTNALPRPRRRGLFATIMNYWNKQ